MLLAVTGAVITGRMMKEEWLPAGELNHVWYLGHLLAWLVVLIGLLVHLFLGAKVGGIPLLVSMFNFRRLQADGVSNWLRGLQMHHSDSLLQITEAIVIIGIILAFLLPAFFA